MSADAPSRASLVATIVVAAAIVIIMVAAVASRNGRNASTDNLRAVDAEAARYTCGMHPQVIESAPGLCPICRMDLVEVDTSGAIDPRIMQSIGVRTAVAVVRPVVRTIRTTGAVTYDETTIGEITVKTRGWLVRMHADFAGKHVEVGDPLFDLNVPDLYSVQERYLSFYRNLKGAHDKGEAPEARTVQNYDQALDILQFYDFTIEQVRELEARDYPAAILTFFSPFRGVIIDKQADRGLTVEPGDRLFRIADLDSVWVMAKVYESDLPYVHEGQPAIVRPSYLPGRSFEGAVGFIYPFVDELTRQVDVRIELDNADRLLKPGMFADVELREELPAGGPLIPRSAVLKTGKRTVVMLSLGGGRFEPRAVTLGVTDDDGMVEITSGLVAGDVVVSSAQFLLDSESNFREAMTPFTDSTSNQADQ